MALQSDFLCIVQPAASAFSQEHLETRSAMAAVDEVHRYEVCETTTPRECDAEDEPRADVHGSLADCAIMAGFRFLVRLGQSAASAAAWGRALEVSQARAARKGDRLRRLVKRGPECGASMLVDEG